jgi:hypothetical protein
MIRAIGLLSFLLIPLVPGTSIAVRDNAPGQVERLLHLAGAPSRRALEAALSAFRSAVEHANVTDNRYLTVIDYTLPSAQERLWVFDLNLETIVRRELVAHGKGSGEAIATAFSNRDGSHMSSLGLFLTDQAYIGSNGYSLRLRGLDPGVNDHAYDRAIVIHGAKYVSPEIAKTGRVGRSWGCPAVSIQVARVLIDTIKDGTLLFAFGPRS